MNRRRFNVRSYGTGSAQMQCANLARAPVDFTLGPEDLQALGVTAAQQRTVAPLGEAPELLGLPDGPIGCRIGIASVEGFIQGIKFEDPGVQLRIFDLFGKDAKLAGRGQSGDVFFEGARFARASPEHRALIEWAVREKFHGHEPSRDALRSSGDAEITHNMGRFDPKPGRTTLPKEVFVRILTEVRDEVRHGRAVMPFREVLERCRTNALLEEYWYRDPGGRADTPPHEVPATAVASKGRGIR